MILTMPLMTLTARKLKAMKVSDKHSELKLNGFVAYVGSLNGIAPLLVTVLALRSIMLRYHRRNAGSIPVEPTKEYGCDSY